MKPRVLLFTLAAVGCAAGWFASSAMWPAAEARRSGISLIPRHEPRTGAAPVNDALMAVHRAGGPGAQIQAALAIAASARPEDFRRLLEQARHLPANSSQTFFMRALLRRWSAADPAAAAAWCAGNSDKQVGEAMRLWALQDTAAAKAFLAALPAHHRGKAVVGVAEALAERDPAAAMKFIAGTAGSDAWDMRRIFRLMAQAGPGTFLESAESLTGELRTTARGVATEEWAKQNFAGAVAWAQQQPDNRDLLQRAFANSKDKSVALQALATLPAALQQDTANTCAYQLFSGGALTLLDRMAGLKGLTPEALASLCNGAAYRAAVEDPVAALAKLEAVFPGQIQSWSNTLATEWIKKDPAAVKAWAGTLPAGGVKEAVLQNIASAEQREATSVAGGTFAERVLTDVRNRTYLSSSAVLRLDSDGRASLLAEMSTMDSGDYRTNNLRRGFEEYYPAEYARWLGTLPHNDARNGQLRNFAPKWAAAEPAAAAAWAITLSAGDARAAALASVAQQWVATDPAAAQAWVRSLPAGPERDQAQQSMEASPF